jgi:hypothetical protein
MGVSGHHSRLAKTPLDNKRKLKTKENIIFRIFINFYLFLGKKLTILITLLKLLVCKN